MNILEEREAPMVRTKDGVKGVDVNDSFSKTRCGEWSEGTLSFRIGVKDTSRRERAWHRDMIRERLISEIRVCLSFNVRRHPKGMRSRFASALWCRIVANVTSV